MLLAPMEEGGVEAGAWAPRLCDPGRVSEAPTSHSASVPGFSPEGPFPGVPGLVGHAQPVWDPVLDLSALQQPMTHKAALWNAGLETEV